jgi:hypothetical protein
MYDGAVSAAGATICIFSLGLASRGSGVLSAQSFPNGQTT